MNYELAKQLKDTGFYQTDDEQRMIIAPNGMDEAYSPTLSELIDACGEKFVELSRYDGHWRAYQDYNNNPTGEGKTPSEAVAKLYLKLKRSNI